MDFVHDQLATGHKIRVLTVVDTFSRFSPVIDLRFSYRAEDVVATLERVGVATGYPKTIRVYFRRSDKWERAIKTAYAALSRLEENPPETISKLGALEADCAASYLRAWVGMPIKMARHKS